MKTAKDADGVAWFLAWQLSQVLHDDIEELIEHAMDHSEEGDQLKSDTLSFRADPSEASRQALQKWRGSN